MRIGLGYDIHRLAKDRDLVLGGVRIPFELGLVGHSDADVLVHAIIDSLLGSLALRDIGFHFPDTDEKYKGVSSLILLDKTYEMIKAQGYEIVNIDANIICQKPKLLNYIYQMRENIAQRLSLELSQISIKAKTNEEVDAIGSSKAIASNAVVLIKKMTA